MLNNNNNNIKIKRKTINIFNTSLSLTPRANSKLFQQHFHDSAMPFHSIIHSNFYHFHSEWVWVRKRELMTAVAGSHVKRAMNEWMVAGCRCDRFLGMRMMIASSLVIWNRSICIRLRWENSNSECLWVDCSASTSATAQADSHGERCGWCEQ